MNNRKLKEASLLTEKQQKFVNAFSGNARIAARDAGYKDPESSADQLTSDPVVLAALKRKQDAMVEESGRRLGAQINICLSCMSTVLKRNQQDISKRCRLTG